MTLPFSWTAQPPAGDRNTLATLVVPVAARAALWGLAVLLLLQTPILILAPQLALPWGISILLVLAWPALLLLLVLASKVPLGQPYLIRCHLDGRGLTVQRRRRFQWTGAKGFAVLTDPPDTLLLVARGGTPVRVPLPPEPQRGALLAAIAQRIPFLPPQVALPYQAAMRFALTDVIALTLIAFANGMAAAVALPLLLRLPIAPALRPAAFFSLCLPTAFWLWLWGKRHYPQFTIARWGLGFFAWLLATGFAGVFGALLVLRAYGLLSVAG